MFWWILLWIVIGLAGLLLAYILLLIISAMLVDMERDYEQESKFYRFLLNSATFCAAKLIRIKLHVTGKELLPDGRFLLVANHRSKFDPILTWLIFGDRQLAFISKPENFKVPVFGRLIHRLCYMPIDRENPRNAVKTINRAVDLINRDVASVAVYPEGTRNYGEGLLPFHNAMFKIAQKAQVPIVIVTMRGTYEIQKNYPLHRSHVYLDVARVLKADEIKGMKTAAIGDLARAIMLESLSKGETN
ncbi:MAG: 1-acyl-sn-glycerol-3-phosphate acyltransferase [Ruminococcus sp.]|nr:1-acyl-sn-glycerol-3-phosphate acyltransferase [Ruminococcus sp.]